MRDFDLDAGAAVLRQPPLGDIEAGQDLDARDDGARHVRRRGARFRQHAVDAQANVQTAAERLDVDVGGAGIEAVEQQLVDKSHHRRAQRQVLEMLDVVVVLAPAPGRQLGLPPVLPRPA